MLKEKNNNLKVNIIMKQLKKTLLTLVALLAVTTGAWADETLLLTIENKDYKSFKSGSQTFDDKVTVTFSSPVNNDGDAHGWYSVSPSSLLTVTGTNGYTITSCKFYTYSGTASTGYTVEGESPSVYLQGGYVYTDDSKSVEIGQFGITKIEVYGAAASSSSGPEVAWNKAEKTGSFTMPGGNVTLEPDYYPQAALAAAPTAVNDVPATTDGAILNAGTVKKAIDNEMITDLQGTVMYYAAQVSGDAAPTAPDYDAEGWTEEVPTAANFAQGKVYVWYYIKGADGNGDQYIFSDSEITALGTEGYVTLAAAPTYAVTFADDTAEPDKWTAEPNAGVKKGTAVTVTYTGTKKVLGVKAEKKAASLIVNPEVGQVIGSDGKNYAYASLPTGVTPVAKICYVSGSNGLALALTDEGKMDWSTALTTCAAHTPAITGGTWKLASQDEWNNMINAADSYTALRDGFSSVGGTNMKKDYPYWSSTEFESGSAWYYSFSYGIWGKGGSSVGYVRACLAF